MTEVLHLAPSSSPPQPNNASVLEISNPVGGDRKRRDQLSFLAFLIDIFRKSWASCKSDRRELCAMEIGWPTNVRHVAHVTFDRFHGFLGLPVELEPQVPRRAPSASAHVFGVSAESMQLSFDSRGNSVPTILLLMQRHLYAQGGLQSEGIFRINAENSQEEYVRSQLNKGVVPEGIHIHCLAGLIKAWFRELPVGVLDSLSPEQVMQCQTQEQCTELVKSLPPTEASLLDWAINLMADVAQQEHLNKMNARNIAMVFAPNMTQMADPLTALMYAVQVMNFLKALIIKTLREREEDLALEPVPVSSLEPSDKNGDQSPSHPYLEDTARDKEDIEQTFIAEEPSTESFQDFNQDKCVSYDTSVQDVTFSNEPESGKNYSKSKIGQSSSSHVRRGPKKVNGEEPVVQEGAVAKTGGISNLTTIHGLENRAYLSLEVKEV